MENQNQIIQTEIKEYQERFHQREEHGLGCEVARDNAHFYFKSPYGKLSTFAGINGLAVTVAQQPDKPNYKELVDFVLLDQRSYLDLTWMDHNDAIVLGATTQYNRLDTVEVNIDNLLGSFLPKKGAGGFIKSDIKQEFHKKHLIVHGENAQLNVVQQIKAFRALLSLNHDDIQAVTLRGFNNMMETALSGCVKMHGIALAQAKQAKQAVATPAMTR